MLIFSSLHKAKEYGFHWIEFRGDLRVHVVERVRTRDDGKRVKELAFAKPDSEHLTP